MIKYALLLLALLPGAFRSFAQTDRRTYKLTEADNKRAEEKIKETAEVSYALVNMISGGAASATLLPMRKSVDQAIKKSGQLISDLAFDRLIKQDIAFTVVGSQSPTPGLSLDLSNQTSLKITGQIPSKRKIVTLDLTASRAEENVPLFADGKFNAQLSAGVNFHIIPTWHFSILKFRPTNSKRSIILQIGNNYSFRREDKQLLDELGSSDNQLFDADLQDTVVVLGCYMRLKQIASLRSLFERDKELEKQLADAIAKKQMAKASRIEALERLINKKAFDSILANYPARSVADIMATVSTDNRKKLFSELMSTYFPVKGKFDTLGDLQTAIEGVGQWKAEVLATDMERVCQRYVRRDMSRQDREIERSRPLWTRKQLNWFTLSAKPAVYSFTSFINDSTATPKAVRVGHLF